MYIDIPPLGTAEVLVEERIHSQNRDLARIERTREIARRLKRLALRAR